MGEVTLDGLLNHDYETLRAWTGDHIAGTYLSEDDLSVQSHRRLAASGALAGRFARLGRRSSHKRSFRCKTPVEHVLSDIFLTSRLGGLNMRFLHLQEGSTADFRAGDLGGAKVSGAFLDLLSRRLGRRALAGMTVSLRWRRRELWSSNIDPFPHLRAIYAAPLVEAGYPVLDLAAFKLKAWVLEQVLRASIKQLQRASTALELVRLPLFRSVILGALELHGERGDGKVAAEVAAGVAPLVCGFGARLLAQFAADGEKLAKFLKMVVAVVVWRALAFQHNGARLSDYVIETFRLALAWASTYPLVDDVLDAGKTTAAERAEVRTIIADFVSGEGNTTTVSAGSLLLREAFEIIAQARTIDTVKTRRAVKLVAEAHILESAKTLGNTTQSPTEEIEVYADTFLKSFLVRVATMVLCGIEPSPSDLTHGMEVALFNQLGDDLLDVAQDMDERRVTPFTLFHAEEGATFNPYTVYLTTVKRLASGDLGAPAVYSCLETLATAWERQPANVRDFMRPHLLMIAEALAWRQSLDDPAGIFYIDPDTILVRGAEALIGLIPAERN